MRFRSVAIFFSSSAKKNVGFFTASLVLFECQFDTDNGVSWNFSSKKNFRKNKSRKIIKFLADLVFCRFFLSRVFRLLNKKSTINMFYTLHTAFLSFFFEGSPEKVKKVNLLDHNLSRLNKRNSLMFI